MLLQVALTDTLFYIRRGRTDGFDDPLANVGLVCAALVVFYSGLLELPQDGWWQGRGKRELGVTPQKSFSAIM